MDQNLNQEILDKLTKVCLCKAIPRSRIKEAIRQGARSVEEVQRSTGAGSGGCGGRRCTQKIQDLIDQHLEAEEQ
jgi:bacterioferritin-associated ferredoxin